MTNKQRFNFNDDDFRKQKIEIVRNAAQEYIDHQGYADLTFDLPSLFDNPEVYERLLKHNSTELDAHEPDSDEDWIEHIEVRAIDALGPAAMVAAYLKDGPIYENDPEFADLAKNLEAYLETFKAEK